MTAMTFMMACVDSPEFYKTTPFELDTSATSLSSSVVVTTTVTEPTGNWAGGPSPVVSGREKSRFDLPIEDSASSK